MHPKSDKLIAGTYKCVKTAKCLAFWVKLGIPENEAKAFVGSHWTAKIVFSENNKLNCEIECKEMPILNLCMSGLEEGKEYITPDQGFGKSSMVFSSVFGTSVRINALKLTIKNEKFGTYEVTEIYGEDGIKMEYVSKATGASYVENWCRDVKETGSFRFKRGENLNVFKEMFPELPKIDEGYKLHVSKCGDTFHKVDTFGDGTSFKTSFKYDEETPFMDCTFLVTKIPGGRKIICNKAGRIQEYTVKYTEGGFYENVLDHSSGKTAFLEFVRFVDFSGEFRPVTNVGGDKIASSFGCPKEVYQKILEDPTTRMIIKETGGKYVMDFKSDSIPKESLNETTTFKLGQEFRYMNMFDRTDEMRMILTAKDNVLLFVGKGKVSITGKYIFTENFLIREIEIQGTNLGDKTIFLRC